MTKQLDSYQDIINLPHFHHPAYPYLSPEKRAAQFMPFKALTVYEDILKQQIKNYEKQTIESAADSDYIEK